MKKVERKEKRGERKKVGGVGRYKIEERRKKKEERKEVRRTKRVQKGEIK